jgi:hypothetical protein
MARSKCYNSAYFNVDLKLLLLLLLLLLLCFMYMLYSVKCTSL